MNIQTSSLYWVWLVSALFFGACASLPTSSLSPVDFPEDAYFDPPQRDYIIVGKVKSRQDFDFIDPAISEKKICRNEFNRAVKKLVAMAKDKGANAVVDVRSVVFLMDGKKELHRTPECSDEAHMGQVLTQGVAVKWVIPKKNLRKRKRRKKTSSGTSRRLKVIPPEDLRKAPSSR